MSTRTAQNAKTLDGKYYTSQDIYEAETQQVFFKHWIYVGRTSALSEPGSYFLREIESESIITSESVRPRGRARVAVTS